MDLVRLKRNVNALSDNLNNMVLEVLDDHELQIKELIHIQLRKGERGDGQLITPQYSDAYAQKKGRDVPDLKVSGEFWDDIKTEKANDVLLIDADTLTRKGFELAEHLEKRYTSKIYELTSESRSKLLELIMPDLQKAFYNELAR